MGKLKDFVNSSKHFVGFTMNGCFDMDISCFEKAFEHYKKTRENVLDEYAELIHLLWESKGREHCEIDKEKIEYYCKLLENKGFWNIFFIFSDEKINRIRGYIEICINELHRLNLYKTRRYAASLYTSNPIVRNNIFERDGRKCIKCGDTESLTLDHIVPIIKGGDNSLDNLQVLCKSCNSSKNTKVKDYRIKNNA